MVGLEHAAGWLRELMTRQAWLNSLKPAIEQMPDWALLTTGPVLLAVFFVLLFKIWPQHRRRVRTDKQDRGAPAVRPVAPRKPAEPRFTVSTRQSGAVEEHRAHDTISNTIASAIAAPTAASDIRRTTLSDDDQSDNRSVRIFVSSTFKDMQRERDVLIKETFPQLRTRLRTRGVEMFEVDLRWGITEEQSQRGETLPTLLAEIDRCRPYFIGLLGERYGWVPDARALTDDLKASFPSVASATGKSVTEMEIVHGVLANAETAKNAIFFERDPGWVEAQSTIEHDNYVETSEEARAKLAELKARVRTSGARIIPYATPEGIGPAVEAALGADLNARFPEKQTLDEFEQTARLHRAYARERRRLHIGAEPYHIALDEWMAARDASALLITGTSGAGKSTLIANWLYAWRAKHQRDIVFEHYLGASPDSADPMLLMRRLWEHLNRATGETIDLPSGDVELTDVASRLAQRIGHANVFAERNGAMVLIALDGLDKLLREQNLRWLPNVPRVKILASSLDSEAKDAASSRGWTALEVKPLSSAERGQFIDRTLESWGRKLSPGHIEAILAHSQAGNPLFLKTVLDELRVSATHARLDERLGIYLSARDIPDLFARMLERLEADCQPGLVARALPVIWASRAGLEETEIVGITATQPMFWATLRNGLSDGLRDQQGRLAFDHDFLRQAVEARYLATDERKRAAHLAVAERFEAREPDRRQAEELPFQFRAAEGWDRLEGLLTDLERLSLFQERGDAELWSYWLALKQQGRDPEMLLCEAFRARAGRPEQWSKSEYHIASALSHLLVFGGAHGDRVLDLRVDTKSAGERLYGDDHPNTIADMNNLAATLSDRGDLSGAIALQQRVVDAEMRLRGADHPRTLTSISNLATIMEQLGDSASAVPFRESVFAARTRLLGSDHRETLKSASELAAVLNERGEHQRAKPILERTLSAQKRTLGDEQLETQQTMCSLAIALKELGDPAGAQPLEERVLEIRAKTLGADHPFTLRTAGSLGVTLQAQGDFPGAEALAQRVFEAEARTLGPEHPSTLRSLNNLATVVANRGDLRRARLLKDQALEACVRVLGEEHPDTLLAMHGLANAHAASGELDNARALEEKVVRLRSRTLGPEHPDTLSSMSNLAQTMGAQGEQEEARSLSQRLLEVRTRVLGSEHPDTLASMTNLAAILQDLGDLADAARIQNQALHAMTKVLGPEHPDTLVSMSNVVQIMTDQGDLPGAQQLGERLLDALRRTHGPNHPETLSGMQTLAICLARRSDFGRALSLQQTVLRDRTSTFGPDHTKTIESLRNYAIILAISGERRKALPYQRQLAEVTMKLFGPSDPQTREAAEGLAELENSLSSR